MKIYGKALALICAFSQAYWGGVAAFSIQEPSKNTIKFNKPHQSALFAATWDLPSISPAVSRVEGSTRKTWKFEDINSEIVQVGINSDGRPVRTDIELWIGPDWTPYTLKAYSQDAALRPIQVLVGTRNKVATIEVRNVGPYEFPLQAACEYAPPDLVKNREEIGTLPGVRSAYVEGSGAIKSFVLEPTVEQAQVLLKTETRQLNTMIELLNGPNNIKQKFEVFTNNGQLNSLYIVFDTPGSGNVIRIRNLAPLEFPCLAYVNTL